ncbi:hypothetical protein GCM10009696_00200 [Kocuria himachalensis]
MDTQSPMGSMVFTVMVAQVQMRLEIQGERITDSVVEHRSAGNNLGGRRPTFSDCQIRIALRLIQAREPATQIAGDHKMSKATSCR